MPGAILFKLDHSLPRVLSSLLTEASVVDPIGSLTLVSDDKIYILTLGGQQASAHGCTDEFLDCCRTQIWRSLYPWQGLHPGHIWVEGVSDSLLLERTCSKEAGNHGLSPATGALLWHYIIEQYSCLAQLHQRGRG